MEILFKILNNNNGYHKDFLIKVDTTEILADTYYFWRDEFAVLSNPYAGVTESVSNYLNRWAKKLEELQLNESVFIPIDFSDEYVTGLKVRCSVDTFIVDLGYIVDINDIVVRVTENEVYTNLNDKIIEIIVSFNEEKKKFINSLCLTK